MLTDLEQALITWDLASEPLLTKRESDAIVEAARRVAHLDYKAGGDLIHAELCEDSCVGWHDAKAVAVALGVTEDAK